MPLPVYLLSEGTRPAYAQGVSQITSTKVATSTPSTLEMCNCYAYVRIQIPSFPQASLVKPNTTPKIGAVVIFNYDGLPHYGIISSFNNDGFELTDSNYGGCGIRTHFVAWGDEYIVGFWSTT